MDTYSFHDVLTGSTISCQYPGLQTLMVEPDGEPEACEAIFFPGCSFINYGLPLVNAVFDTLKSAQLVDGISLLCCGKILGYEENGKQLRSQFEEQLRQAMLKVGVKKVVTACPNCTIALRTALAQDERTADVEVIALPTVLSQMGYKIDMPSAHKLLEEVCELGKGFYETDLTERKPQFCVHDSCPDRALGEFADGTRELLGEGSFNECAHVRKKSFCCGSLVRAAGHIEAADKQARKHGDEALDAQATGIVTACVSCAFQLSMAQRKVPVFHYLELLYRYRINWYAMEPWMKLRFLFDESLGVDELQKSTRAYVSLEQERE